MIFDCVTFHEYSLFISGEITEWVPWSCVSVQSVSTVLSSVLYHSLLAAERNVRSILSVYSTCTCTRSPPVSYYLLLSVLWVFAWRSLIRLLWRGLPQQQEQQQQEDVGSVPDPLGCTQCHNIRWQQIWRYKEHGKNLSHAKNETDYLKRQTHFLTAQNTPSTRKKERKKRKH